MGGEDAVKAAGDIYLPKLGDQSTDEYGAYKMRAMFFNATGRTVESFVGMIFRKDPTEKIPDSLKSFVEDATLQGQSWIDYEKTILREVIAIGRSGTLIEWSADEAKPYACNYQAEQVINWKTKRIKGRTVLSMVVLEEQVDGNEVATAGTEKTQTAQPDNKTLSTKAPKPMRAGYDVTNQTGPEAAKTDEFDENKIPQIRVLKLIQEGEQVVYVVEIWQKEKDKAYRLIDTIRPQRKGKPIESIPFVFHGPNNLLPFVDRSPVEDIVSINLSHYRSSADLEHGRHFTGLPTAYAAGFDTKQAYKIGSATAWVSSEPNAKAAYLEFTGQGLQALDKALEQKERQMAVLGARMLEQEKKGVETEAVLQMKQTGEQSSLSQIARTAGESLELVLRWALWWQGAADSVFADTEKSVEVKLNQDFNASDMSPQLITAIIAAVQAGILTKDSAVTALKRGELVSSARTVEEELALLETEAPALQGDNKNL